MPLHPRQGRMCVAPELGRMLPGTHEKHTGCRFDTAVVTEKISMDFHQTGEIHVRALSPLRRCTCAVPPWHAAAVTARDDLHYI